ncbi:MAG: hypothetical protein QM271_11085 [Bacillota bacterium]|nr:hypothetical protein [Bacillota bacterium]
MRLFVPVWMTDNVKKCDKAVEYVKKKIDNDEDLLHVTRQAKLDAVKTAAAAKLASDMARVSAIQNTRCVPAQEAAVEGLSDRSLIDNSLYFAIGADYVRKSVIPDIIDESLLAEIVRRDSSPQNRLAALRKTTDEQIAIEALQDKSEEVREEAIFHVHDNEIVARYLANHGSFLYSRRKELYARIDTFSKGQLEMLANGNIRDATGHLKTYACGRLGHQMGKNCRCIRCNASLQHTFDKDGVCQNCGARQVKERKILSIMGEPYGYREDLILEYPDGEKETIQTGERVITVSQDKMDWLLTDH